MYTDHTPERSPSTRRTPRTRLIALAVTAAIVLAACGGDDDDAAEPTDEATSNDTTAETTAETTAATETTAAATDETTADEPAADGDYSDWNVHMILDGSAEDGGWNTTHLAGGNKIVDTFPGIGFSYVEEIAPGQTATNAFEDAVAGGADMVIGTTYYQDDMMEVAAANPDVLFVTWAGFETADNVGHFDAASEDGRYIDGMLAGMLTESNIIGYPVGFPYNEVNRSLNAFTLGAREVNPDVQVQAVYVNTWFDPAVEQQAAEALVNAGADVLAHEVGAQVYATVAAQNGGYVLGYTNDWSDFAPESWAGGFRFDWGTYYVEQVGAMIDGTWEPEISFGGLADGYIDFAPYGSAVTDEMLATLDERKASIIDGSFDMFAGPIFDNNGNEVVAEGDTIPFESRTACCQWLVEGIVGQIPG